MFTEALAGLFSFSTPLTLVLIVFILVCLALFVFKLVAFIMDVLPFI